MKGALVILAVTVVAGFLLWLGDRLWLRRRGAVASSEYSESSESSEFSEFSEYSEYSEYSESPDVAGVLPKGPVPAQDSECCGLHLMCEKLGDAALADKPVYYDDEELDRFAGRLPGDYSPAEAEEFRDVLLTMLPADVPGWARSLDLRGIRPPQEIRDELLIMLNELR